MITTMSYNYLEDFTDKLRIKGRYTFSLEEIRTEFKTTEEAIKKALNRMTNKGKITPLRKGFYLIVPPEYSVQKTLPPIMFMDQMMRYLEKKYYVGLLNAASFFGASHQAPQEFFVITEKPPLRPIKKGNLTVNFIIKTNIAEEFLESRKTEAGYIKVSGPELTAIDLLLYEKRIGGINRCFTILNELHEAMKPSVLKKVIAENVPIPVLQRLGYLLDLIHPDGKLSAVIFDALKESIFRNTPLKTGKPSAGYTINNKWKILENTIPESDL